MQRFQEPSGCRYRHFERALCLLSAFVLLGVYAHALNPELHISQYGRRSWPLQEGFLGGRPYAITQTLDGYLWVGTRTGLFRFDGVRYVHWHPPLGEPLPSEQIWGLLGARDGSLWIGTSAGLARWDGHVLGQYGDVTGTVDHILEDDQGAIWVTRLRQTPICRIASAVAHCFGEKEGIPTPARDALSLLKDRGGKFWYGTSTSLVQWQPGFSKEYPLPAFKNNNTDGIDGLAQMPDGTLWVGVPSAGSGLGLQQFVKGRWKPFHAPQLDGSTLSVEVLYTDRNGALWIGTANQGVFRFYRGLIDHFDSSDGLSGDRVWSFYEDHEGNMWVVTTEGIDSFRDLRVSTFTKRQGLTEDDVVSVLAAADGTILVGNDRGLDSIREGRFSSIRTGHGLPGVQVTSLFQDRAKQLWIGIDNDLYLFRDRRFRKIRRRDGRSIGFVVDMTEDPSHDIWVEVSGTNKSLLHLKNLQVVDEFPSPATPSGRNLSADNQGNIWIGLRTGDLARFHNGQTEIIHYPHGRDMDTPFRQVIVNPDNSVSRRVFLLETSQRKWDDSMDLFHGTRFSAVTFHPPLEQRMNRS
jgi:ligand-binding sensor domain-containing protein